MAGVAHVPSLRKNVVMDPARGSGTAMPPQLNVLLKYKLPHLLVELPKLYVPFVVGAIPPSGTTSATPFKDNQLPVLFAI